MRPAVVTAILLLGVLLLCGYGSAFLNILNIGCEEDWTWLDHKRCMKFFDSKKSAHFAEKECQKEDAHLVSIHNYEQNARVAYYVQNTMESEDEFWIGIMRPRRAVNSQTSFGPP